MLQRLVLPPLSTVPNGAWNIEVRDAVRVRGPRGWVDERWRIDRWREGIYPGPNTGIRYLVNSLCQQTLSALSYDDMLFPSSCSISPRHWIPEIRVKGLFIWIYAFLSCGDTSCPVVTAGVWGIPVLECRVCLSL